MMGGGERWDSLLCIGRHADSPSTEDVLDGFMIELTFAHIGHVAEAEASAFIGSSDGPWGLVPSMSAYRTVLFLSRVSFACFFFFSISPNRRRVRWMFGTEYVQYMHVLYALYIPTGYSMLHERSPVDG